MTACGLCELCSGWLFQLILRPRCYLFTKRISIGYWEIASRWGGICARAPKGCSFVTLTVFYRRLRKLRRLQKWVPYISRYYTPAGKRVLKWQWNIAMAPREKKEQGLKRDSWVSLGSCRGCAPNQRQMLSSPRLQPCTILQAQGGEKENICGMEKEVLREKRFSVPLLILVWKNEEKLKPCRRKGELCGRGGWKVQTRQGPLHH